MINLVFVTLDGDATKFLGDSRHAALPILDLQLSFPFLETALCGEARVFPLHARVRDRCVTQSHPLRLDRASPVAPDSPALSVRGYY